MRVQRQRRAEDDRLHLVYDRAASRSSHTGCSAPIAAAAVRPAAIDFTIFMVVFFRSFARRRVCLNYRCTRRASVS